MTMGAVVVTGASTGIGETVSLGLDRAGARVFAGVRKESDGLALRQKASDRLTPVLLDVTDAESVAACAALVAEAVGEAGLAGLVNNAGVCVGGPLEFLPLDDLRRQFEVNLFGVLAVTQAFLPQLRRARGRIVNMSSITGRVASPFVGPYSASKFALEALTETLRMELQPWGIGVSVVGPGEVATPIWQKSVRAADERFDRMPSAAREMYGPTFEAVRRQALKVQGSKPEAVLAAVQHALTAPRPKARYRVGADAMLVDVLRQLPVGLRESIVRKRFL
ncbi:MAG TPA: SDR family NAD(P)-dependent oxidoreductase [Symbiobacteriaceae bacterium]|nr:SDR family NAD(P)-dependent oxidoreductase [Symbiobacteriaceae bacterium]